MSGVGRFSLCHFSVTVAIMAAMLCCTLSAKETQAQPAVELITFGPGDDIWSRFGHVGIRVTYPVWDEDLVFSYGYAPFGEPSFIWGYLRGTSRFALIIERWDDVLERYGEMDRTIVRQPLNLSASRRTELMNRLILNARPENREYVYDHLYDNCSTRVRDLLDDVTSGTLSRAAWYRDTASTYRDLTLRAGQGRVDALILLDLLSGPNQELPVDGWAQMYLPAALREVVAVAQVTENGRRAPLAGPIEVAYKRRGPPPQWGSRYLGRWVVLMWSCLLGAGLLFGRSLERPPSKRSRRFLGWMVRWQLRLTVIPVGVIGLALFVFALISEVRELQWNENALLFWPLDFALLAVSGRWRRHGVPWLNRWLRAYLWAHLAVVVALVAMKLLGVLQQDNWAFIGASALLFIGCVLLPTKEQVELASGRWETEVSERPSEQSAATDQHA